MKTCLLLVDLQKGFVSPNTLKVVPRIKELLENDIFDITVFTQFLNQQDSPFMRILNWKKIKSPEEQDLIEEVKPFASKVVKKTTYTGVNKELLTILSKHKIEAVFIAGIDTDCCVLKTSVDMFERNILSFVLTYYSASNGGINSHKAAITVLRRLIGKDKFINKKITSEIIDQKCRAYKLS